METLQDFFLLKDPNVSWVLGGVILMCASAALVGVFAFLRKRALVGDAISHAILPGVCLAFLITQTKHPLILLIGAFISGILGLWSIDSITRYSKLKSDAALALVLSVFYGLGIMLLTIIQGTGIAAQAGLDKFLFGKAAAMLPEDVQVFGIFAVLLMAIVLLNFRAFKFLIFDRNYALTIGLPVKRLEALLSILTVLAIALGIQAVGVVLMAALLIAPAAAARYWTQNLVAMIAYAMGFAVLSGIMGTYVSYALPRMPTGPWIVSILALMAILSVIFGRKRGLWARFRRRSQHTQKMLHENILKCLYQLGETNGHVEQAYSLAEIQARRFIKLNKLKKGTRSLTAQGLLQESELGFAFTAKGVEAGKRVVRVHRLWELYLTRYLQLPTDHVHEDAEAIEHIITPEIEQDLAHLLEFPEQDPHASPIPYQDSLTSDQK